MEIHVVQQGDTIESIAENYGVTIERIIVDNGLDYPYNLVIGQAIVITYPKQTHTVLEGNTLQSIADSFNIPLMQLLRNNPFLSEREYIYPGETLVISYNTIRDIKINGFTYPFINRNTLIKTLPNLTYLSIFNYTVTEKGDVIPLYDDVDIINVAKEYGVTPIMLLTNFTPQGKPNIDILYNILLNNEYWEKIGDQIINIMKSKGYQGVNIIFSILNENNQTLYQNFVQKVANRLEQEDYKFKFIITINYNVTQTDDNITLEQIDYSILSNYVDEMMFLKFTWGSNTDPPAPVSNINHIRALINNIITEVSTDKVAVGKQMIGYDWQLPYVPGSSRAASLALNSIVDLAYQVGAVIQFDEESQTPYLFYNQVITGSIIEHIIWFIDARSIVALDQLIVEYGLNGSGVWNIMEYYQPLWTVINSNFNVIKLI
jgi:spore germination protein